jgi:hypothetical protein
MRTIAIAVAAAGAAAMLGAQARQGGAPALPKIVVGGIQVANVAVPKDDMFGRPFMVDNGTTLVLWVQMPPGQGLIEVDDDASLLQRFADDKGTSLEGRLDPFPDEFKDGSGATLDITSKSLPAADATRLIAEGMLAMIVSDGSKPQRVTGVQLANGRTFTLGKDTVTLADVGIDDKDQRFTLKLSRQLMQMIKAIRFFDATNQPLESRHVGGGFSSDAGEMIMTVTTASKTLTLEVDVWQGRRTIKVPFKVQAGVGLGG